MMARDEPLDSPIEDLTSDEEADTLNVNEVENEAQIAEQSGVSNSSHVDEITQQMETMNLGKEDLRLAKKKVIDDIYKSTSSVDRLEMLVITRIRDETYYAFRRQFNGAFNAINKETQISDNGRVVLWFVSNNAIQDFKDCREYLRAQAKYAGVELNIINNTITGHENIDTVGLLKEFGIRLGMLELDPTFMQKSLELVQGSLQKNPIEDKIQDLTDFANKHSDPMIVDIYNHVLRDVKLKLKM